MGYGRIMTVVRRSAPQPPAAAELGNFTPTSGSIGQLIVIGLANMPAGFTLTSITLNGVALANPTKNSDSEVQGNVTPSNSTGVLVVTYDTTETVDSSGLDPSDFTVT